MTTAIWWVRRDLRLLDNPALAAAIQAAPQVIPLFILDDHLLFSPKLGERRRAFLFAGLRELDSSLRQRGSRLVLRAGDPHTVLEELISSAVANEIFSEADGSPYAMRRDSRIASHLPLNLVGSSAILPPGSVLKSDGSPYTVFTPFSRAWLAVQAAGGAPIPPPSIIHTPETITGLPIPEDPVSQHSLLFPAGEQEALRRLDAFTRGEQPGVYRYAQQRDRLDLDGTSRLSPYLRFGMLSPRQVVRTAQAAIESASDARDRKSVETWLNELIWRDFYMHILFHVPQVLRSNFRSEPVHWDNDPLAFQAWCAGRTGYPVVDASMHQLTSTGWMHNRGRMIVASFLTKHLLIDWRLGEQFFMQHLLDCDPAANNGGWQWTAGTGTDASPYFRIFNPIIQSKKFDPHGAFIRHWLPELARVSDEFIHEPWSMPLAAQKQASCQMGEDYPHPIVDHAWARQRALVAYSRAKSS